MSAHRKTVHPLVLAPPPGLIRLRAHLPTGSEIPDAGMIHFPYHRSNPGISTLFARIHEAGADGTAMRGLGAEDDHIITLINAFHAQDATEKGAAGALWQSCLHGTPWLDKSFPAAHRFFGCFLPSCSTVIRHRANGTQLRPLVFNVREDAFFRPCLEHLPERDELQIFVIHPDKGGSRHAFLQATRGIPAEIALWTTIMKNTAPLAKPIFVHPQDIS